MKKNETACAGKARTLQPELVRTRRELHRIPETGLFLPETRQYLVDRLKEMGVEYTLNTGDSGITAYVNRGKSGKVIALRTDMDALTITEETGADYSSTHEGRMHACGHDAHMAMLLGALQILNEEKEQLQGEVRFLFQTGEEIAKGAMISIENGAIDGADAVFGMHIGTVMGSQYPAGTLIAAPGPVMASFDRFRISVRGIGSHGSTPEKGIDPVQITAHIVLALESINAREFNANTSLALTIGSIHGGNQYNVIPDTVVMEGSSRSFDEKVRRKIAQRIEEISRATAAAFGGEADVFIDWGAPPVVNDAQMAAFAAEAAAEVLGTEQLVTEAPVPSMIGEDFACYLQKIPGAFLFLSSSNAEKGSDCPHHHPHFVIDEDVLWEGTAVFCRIAEKFLK